ncbi:MAG TPA: 4-hydroxy-3-methylbut-2-enyl diphosphate reductase, partial [Prolixibacteraceae bacterium]|nr:4-hydroxy-3-methylbut-2-enyl diphosphate reductase [Prolixibacteraceae bacterium]
MHIEIDNKSGFCFGVQNAINKVEEHISDGKKVNCLGDIVHNHEEISRLTQKGMDTIHLENLDTTQNSTVLVRSHGEPPSTFNKLNNNNNKIIDATCPVVSKLQNRIKLSFNNIKEKDGQLVIFGKKQHPEIIGLNGQTQNQSIIITTKEDLKNIDFNRPIEVYSQTTMPVDDFRNMISEIESRAKSEIIIHDTICRQVSGRVPHLRKFVKKFDIVIFVSGKKSSNGKLLFEVCKSQNPNTYFISSPEEMKTEWIKNAKEIGICGATSTPLWLME